MLLKSDTSSTSPGDRRVGPDMLEPTARTFFDKAGETMPQPVMSSPMFPAAKMSRCSGFWSWGGGGGGWGGGDAKGGKHGAQGEGERIGFGARGGLFTRLLPRRRLLEVGLFRR